VEVFNKGHRLFPRSVRTLIGLGSAWYLRGSYEQAADKLCDASDLEPGNESPHVFLGRLVSAESSSTARVRNTLKRYASLRPKDANANYLYALALWKPANLHDPQLTSQVEWLLKNATRLDPNFTPGYLQLGIVYGEKQDFPMALVALKKAAALDPKSEQAHYRLAQIYRHLGQSENAQREMQAYQQSAREREEETAREQRLKQVFIFTPRVQSEAADPK
jgi:tetratricopeptide (TPR) repeat protein